MDRLFAARAFSDFGPSRLAVLAPRLCAIAGPRSSALRRQVREQCPKLPGVYGMVDVNGELIYVGKAKSLRGRLLSYFRPRSRDPKAGRILRHAVRIVWEVAACEFAALHRELELIRRWRPRCNVLGQPGGWRYTYVCLGRAPAPYLFLTRRPPKAMLAQFGPVRAGRRASEAVRRLNDWFGLRDCPRSQEMVFAEDLALFPAARSAGCIRHEIGTCLGPCAGLCTQSAYDTRVRQARAFLDGRDTMLLKGLQCDMIEAARAQAYERAAVLRDKLDALHWLHRQLEQLRELRQDGSFIYPVKSPSGLAIWYLIRDGCTVAALPAPQNPESRKQAAKVIETVYRQHHFNPTPEQIESVLLVAAWFRKFPKERRKTMNPAAAMS